MNPPSLLLTYLLPPPPLCSDRDGDVEISSTKRRRGDSPPTAAVLHSRSRRSLQEAAGDPQGGAGAADGEVTTQSCGKGTRSGRSSRR